ncbi:ATP-grasp domain-containing protein [Halomonas marinisediminis]|uniref:ATP-grasp domain-containing protein n=1 Tax=Halomonas marinisediminis TaxID=2546095 RepID=A0ABY2D3S5_9GAMM|nr:hypothetical protein [Halomonas marinisediminis]TDA95756.1 hypothetical protein E0702_15165 [Halomonas marinisediminis]
MLAIHQRDNSYSAGWIRYCIENNISYKVVDCFSNDIVEQVKDCDAVLWHFHHGKRADMSAAPRVLRALEHSGVKVFPNRNTSWYFDDKAAQKYLFDALEIPSINTHVFYDVQSAKEWLDTAQYPLVFKSSSGAGSSGVKLVNTKKKASKQAKRSIVHGVSSLNKASIFRDVLSWSFFKNNTLKKYITTCALLILPRSFFQAPSNETGVAIFQEYIPDNDSDVRIIVIGDKAFGIRRFVRSNDFRASGSGKVSYDVSNISKETVRLSFLIADKLDSDCCAIDFIYSGDRPRVVEVSYGFSVDAYKNCAGYWNRDLVFVTDSVDPCGWMIENVRLG